MPSPFVNELESLGYFHGLPPDRAAALKLEFVRKGWSGLFMPSHRLFMSDAEDLAEGGISEFIRHLAPFLSAEGVVVPPLEDLVSESGYAVRVGGQLRVIYDAADLEREQSAEPGRIWGMAMVRGFSIVDELLESAGSHERLYAINGGNDLFAFFMTPAMHRLISAHPDAHPAEGPYRPKPEYPDFGNEMRE